MHLDYLCFLNVRPHYISHEGLKNFGTALEAMIANNLRLPMCSILRHETKTNHSRNSDVGAWRSLSVLVHF